MLRGRREVVSLLKVKYRKINTKYHDSSCEGLGLGAIVSGVTSGFFHSLDMFTFTVHGHTSPPQPPLPIISPINLKFITFRLEIVNLITFLLQTFREINKTTVKYSIVIRSHTRLGVESKHELVTLGIDNILGDVEVRQLVN
jgi:hypothetical protein